MADGGESEVDGRVEENDDGTIIVRLHRHVKTGGESHTRITVHEFTSKILPKAERMEKEGATTEVMLDIARDLCTPKGASDALRGMKDTQNLVQAVTIQMGKYQDG